MSRQGHHCPKGRSVRVSGPRVPHGGFLPPTGIPRRSSPTGRTASRRERSRSRHVSAPHSTPDRGALPAHPRSHCRGPRARGWPRVRRPLRTTRRRQPAGRPLPRAFAYVTCPNPNVKGVPRVRLPGEHAMRVPHRPRGPQQDRWADDPHLRDARARRVRDPSARSHRRPVRRPGRRRVVRVPVAHQVRDERRPRVDPRRPARYASRRPAPGVRRLRRDAEPGVQHRVHVARRGHRRRRGHQGLRRPVQRRPVSTCPPTTPRRTPPTSPTCAWPSGIPSWNVYGVSYGTEARPRQPARPSAGDSLADHRLGVAAEPQHRQGVVVGAGGVVQGHLRRLPGPARLRGRVPDPRGRLLRHREAARRVPRRSSRPRTHPVPR